MSIGNPFSNISSLSPRGEKHVDGVVVQTSLAATMSQAREQKPLEDGHRQRTPNRPQGRGKVARANRVKFINIPELIIPVERNFISRHGLPRLMLRYKKVNDRCVD